MNDGNEKVREKLFTFLKDLNIPDPAVLKNVFHTSKMSFEKFINYDLNDYSTLDLLAKAEMIAQLLKFSTDTKRIQETIAKDLNIPLRSIEIEESTKKFLTDLKSLNVKTSASLERDYDTIKEYGIMQDLQKLPLLNPNRLKENYIHFFEAIMYKYIYPIAHKMKPKKKQYRSPSEAIRIINQKTKNKHKELLKVINIEL